MSGGSGSVPEMPRDSDRKAAVDALCEAFARDHVSLEELERRLDEVTRAGGRAELRALLADLPHELLPPPLRAPRGAAEHGRKGGVPVSAGRGGGTPARDAALPGRARASAVELAVWSGRVRRGRWTPARRTTVVAFMGGVELDLREADLTSPVTELFVFSLMGGIEIIVPPWVRIEGQAFAFMGGYEEDEWTGVEAEDDAPVVRISGFVMMGGVDVIVRYPGESGKEAKQRRKAARRRRRNERRRIGGE